MSFFAPREAKTNLECPACRNKLHICRSCHEVFIKCPVCGKNYDLKEMINQADEAMEKFLENVYMDRI